MTVSRLKDKPEFYVHNVTKEKLKWSEYCNFGSGDRGKIKDLPKDGYPYSVLFTSDV